MHRAWLLTLLSIISLAGCPTDEDPPADPPYGWDDPPIAYGWQEEPAFEDLALWTLWAWTDFHHPLLEPVFGAGGCRAEIEQHDPEGGPVVWNSAVNYEDRGFVLTSERDDDADGTFDSWAANTFDGAGMAERHEQGEGAAGGQAKEVVRYEHDAGGRMTREALDWSGDGDEEAVHTWAYDGEGRMTERSYTDTSEPGSHFTWTETYQWSGDGCMEHMERTRDSQSTGISEDAATLECEEGRRTRFEYDDEADGTTDWIREYAWDEEGNLVEQRADLDADGVVDETYTLVYDPAGRPTFVELDPAAGATGTMELTWDEDGHLLDLLTQDFEGWGGGTGHEVREYDDGGRVLMRCQDDDPTQCAENVDSYEWNGNLLVAEGDWIGGDEQRLDQTVLSWTCP